jgi:hypothetical protein
LTNRGGNYSADQLQGLKQIGTEALPTAPNMGGLGFAEAGTVKADVTQQPSKVESLNDLTKLSDPFNDKAFCTAQFNAKYVEAPPEMLHNTGVGNKAPGLSSLKQIHQSIVGHAEGGLPHKYAAAAPKGHKPEFVTGLTGYYACGGGTGQSDDIPAMLHDGDYVMDAETVSALGDGSSKAGMHVLEGFRKQIPHKAGGGSNPVPAKIADGEYVFPAAFVTSLGGGNNKKGAEILDGLREKLRAHKRGAPLDSIPPKAKSPIDYIKKGGK